MKAKVNNETIPMPFRERYAELMDIIDPFCDLHLNDEYKTVCQQMAADLCYEGSSIVRGKAASWAAGIIWSVGRVNFLSDPSHDPTMTQDEFSKLIKVSPATISAKSREIWDELNLMQLDPSYTVASMLDSNPLVWMTEINGFIIDLRFAPREIQVAAFEKGLIPYVPDDRVS